MNYGVFFRKFEKSNIWKNRSEALKILIELLVDGIETLEETALSKNKRNAEAVINLNDKAQRY
ncbi:MAG TPA: hypothetical protein VF692_03465 [Pyrinomonadaceae bacterium]|jgi:hypothetical protein